MGSAVTPLLLMMTKEGGGSQLGSFRRSLLVDRGMRKSVINPGAMYDVGIYIASYFSLHDMTLESCDLEPGEIS